MKRNGTITYLKQAIDHCDVRIDTFKGDNNPQVKEMLIMAQAQREAFEAVLDSLRGQHFNIKTFC